MNSSCIGTISFSVCFFFNMDEEINEHSNCSFPHAFVCSLLQRMEMNPYGLMKEENKGYAGQESFFSCSFTSSQGLLIARLFVSSSCSMSLILSAVNDLICLACKMLKAFRLE